MSKPKPNKTGRPRLAKGEAKGKTVAIRLDTEDYTIVAAAAKSGDQTLSAWIRHTLRTAAEQEMFDGTLHKAMKVILLEREAHTATTEELIVEIEQRSLYKRRGGKAAKAKQIDARVRKYPGLFQFAGPGLVRLVSISPDNAE